MSLRERIFDLPTDPTGKCTISVFEPPASNSRKAPILLWAYGGSKDFSQQHHGLLYLKGLLVLGGIITATFDYRGMCQDCNFYNTGPATRAEDTIAALKLLKENYPGHPLILGGNSLGGYTVASTLGDMRTPKIAGIILMAPAAYDPKVNEVSFGLAFSEIIRKQGSWKTSWTFSFLAKSICPKLLLYCEEDKIVPREITDSYIERSHFLPEQVHSLPGEHRVFAHLFKVEIAVKIITKFIKSAVM